MSASDRKRKSTKKSSPLTRKITLNWVLSNKRVLMIVSLAIALIIWMSVSTGAAVEETKTIKNVPIEFDASGSLYQTFGLRVTESDVDAVDVEVTGARFVISTLSASDIKIVASTGSVTKSGEYQIPLRASFQSSGIDASVSIKSSDTITAFFDTFETVSLPVETEASSSIRIKQGYVLGVVTASPAYIQLQGPSTFIRTVSRAVARYNSTNEEIDTSFIQNSAITLQNENGEDISNANLTLSSSSVEVSVPVLKRKTVNVAVKLLNAPDGYAERYIKISPATIEIAGTSEIVDAMSELTVGTLDISTITESDTMTYTLALGENLRDVDSVGYVKVTVDYSKVKSKTITIDRFRVEGLEEDITYSVSVLTQSLPNVSVYARNTDISSVSSSNLTAVVKVDPATLSVGQSELPVTLVSDKGKVVWAAGTYTVVVNVTAN